MKFGKVIKDLLTEGNGDSYCPVRVFAAFLSTPAIVLFVTGFSEQIYHGKFNGLDLATAFSTMTAGFAALGAGVAIKGYSDRKDDDCHHDQPGP